MKHGPALLAYRASLIGKKFNRLTILSLTPLREHGGKTKAVCLCDCGNQTEVHVASLSCGNTTSCGCRQRENIGKTNLKHGKNGQPIKQCWASMMARCYNPRASYYEKYGGRGISVCERWHKFENFLADMGEPEGGLTLDRIDNDKGYSPENCRWATRKQQQRNTSRNVWLDTPDGRMTVVEAGEKYNLPWSVIYSRLRRGWGPEHLFRPVSVACRPGLFRNRKRTPPGGGRTQPEQVSSCRSL